MFLYKIQINTTPVLNSSIPYWSIHNFQKAREDSREMVTARGTWTLALTPPLNMVSSITTTHRGDTEVFLYLIASVIWTSLNKPGSIQEMKPV